MIEFHTIHQSIKQTTGYVSDALNGKSTFNVEQDAVVASALNEGWKVMFIETNTIVVNGHIHIRRSVHIYRDKAYLQQMDRINNAIEETVKGKENNE